MASASEDNISDFDRLQQTTKVVVKQKGSGFHGNKYLVTTLEDRLLFTLKEETSTLKLMVGGGHDRGFHVSAFDSKDDKVFTLRRPYTLGADKMEVSIGGSVVGVVRKEVTLAKPLFSINGANNCPVYRVKGDYSQREFSIQTPNKTVVGAISKKSAGLVKEAFTNLDNYCIAFPPAMSVEHKALVIGTCVLIDYKFHEL